MILESLEELADLLRKKRVTLKIAIHTLSLPIVSLTVFRQRYKVSKIRVKIKNDDETETEKGGDDIGVSAETPETPEFSTKDALNAVTILQTFFMQKTDIEYSNLVFYKS